METITNYFYTDRLAVIMMALVGVVGLSVAAFSTRYLKGDARYRSFFINLFFLLAAVFIMVSADHLALFLISWGISNLLLTRLMVHKSVWNAARVSGILALRNFVLGFVSVAVSFLLLYQCSGETSIQKIIRLHYTSSTLAIVLPLLFLAATTQSALWPFHRWLTSSLNSPTPVSALMHAGLVNGGGFLVARFAPLYFETTGALIVIFILGLVTAILGTLWKLMQSDVKRMLACSTMGQMGFMMVQCGLGLFPAAIAHLCLHGLFKAYLFLSSGSAAQAESPGPDYPPALKAYILSVICGGVGACAFARTSHKALLAGDTTLFLVGIAFVAAMQFALSILRRSSWKRLPVAFAATAFLGVIYGLSVYSIENTLSPLNLFHPQALGTIHILGFLALTVSWLIILFRPNRDRPAHLPNWITRLYVAMLNASQPHPQSITAHRNHYKYL